MSYRVCKRTIVAQYNYLGYQFKGRLLHVVDTGLSVSDAMKLKRKKNRERTQEEARIFYYRVERE